MGLGGEIVNFQTPASPKAGTSNAAVQIAPVTTQLILKRAEASHPSGQWNDDDFDVLADGGLNAHKYTSLLSAPRTVRLTTAARHLVAIRQRAAEPGDVGIKHADLSFKIARRLASQHGLERIDLEPKARDLAAQKLLSVQTRLVLRS